MNGTEILPPIPAPPPPTFFLSRNGIIHDGKYVVNWDGGSDVSQLEIFASKLTNLFSTASLKCSQIILSTMPMPFLAIQHSQYQTTCSYSRVIFVKMARSVKYKSWLWIGMTGALEQLESCQKRAAILVRYVK